METRQERISRIFKQFRDLSIKVYTSLSELLITHLTGIRKVVTEMKADPQLKTKAEDGRFTTTAIPVL